MNVVFSRSRVLARNGLSARLPVAHMVCNQTPPVGEKPSLMTFREVSNTSVTRESSSSLLIMVL
jgi:oligopeptidase A